MSQRLRLGARLAAVALLVGGVGAAEAHVSVSVGLGFGVPVYGGVGWGGWGGYRGGYYGHRGWARPYWGGGVVVAAPWVVVPYAPYGPAYDPPSVRPPEPPAVSVPPTKPDPVIYPRNGQDANQTEYDRQACNRWATTQPAAVADAGVFQRAVEACMDGRGYTMK